MNHYKNLDIYTVAFDLSIRIYRFNLAMPGRALPKQSIRLRHISLRIKDIIAEGYSSGKQEEITRFLRQAESMCREINGLLAKIKDRRYRENEVTALAKSYSALANKLRKRILEAEEEAGCLSLPFPVEEITVEEMPVEKLAV